MPGASSYFLGRQPIVDGQQRLVAYELLFRRGENNEAQVLDDLVASATVIGHAMADLGLMRLLEDKPAFINVSENLLFSDALELLPADRVVLEILETVELSDPVRARCHELKALGYRLALDDVVELLPSHLSILPLVDVVKIDVAALSPSALTRLVAELKAYPVQLLAEKVADEEDERRVRELGFHLFQGYHYARPVVLSGRKLDAGESQLIHLTALLSRDAELPEIELALKSSPALMLGLLRLVNSVGVGCVTHVDSVRQAVSMLGRQQLQRWVQILLYARHQSAGAGGLMMHTAATRSRLMESLARLLHPESPEQAERAALCGLMSLLDQLLAQPFAELLPELHLSRELVEALETREGELGSWLEFACALEREDWGCVMDWLDHWPRLDLTRLNQMQVEALSWAAELERGVAA